jgi:hypothetical protein
LSSPLLVWHRRCLRNFWRCLRGTDDAVSLMSQSPLLPLLFKISLQYEKGNSKKNFWLCLWGPHDPFHKNRGQKSCATVALKFALVVFFIHLPIYGCSWRKLTDQGNFLV